MKDDQFTKLFRYMEKRFDEIDKHLDIVATKDDISKVYDILDQHTTNQSRAAHSVRTNTRSST